MKFRVSIRLLLAVILPGIHCVGSTTMAQPGGEGFRPPSVPLVACDPYFSIWSGADTLYGDHTRHWTNRPHRLTSLIRIDDQTYRLMGTEPDDLPVLKQTDLQVMPTRTVYTFAGAGVRLDMTFMQAALPDDIDLMSRPVTWLTWRCTATDGQSHEVSVYFDATMDVVVNEPDQEVVWSRHAVDGLDVLRAGSAEQNVLARKGDNVRIDWGYFYLAAARQDRLTSGIAMARDCRGQFISRGSLPTKIDGRMPRAVRDETPVMAMCFQQTRVGPGSDRTCSLILAYDDIESILYFGQRLKAYWQRDGKQIGQIMQEAVQSFDDIVKRCEAFDQELIADLRRAGGEHYVKISSLAYRQALAANKIAADRDGMPLMFSKENFSNGCMGTVDVFYPFAPQVLLLNPTLARASFVPILEYARSPRWKFPFAPHDIGTYPHALGQVYGGGERSEENQMPVEECGNMILLVAAVAEAEGNADFARQYWDLMTTWAEYLKSKGLDPENQLCTDDFAGHLAHNVNLSLKAIVALGAYAKLADQIGARTVARDYRRIAEQYVEQWMEMADDGDHYRLAFDKPGTWSQKYNLVWDRLLKLDLFPPTVARKEMAYYRKIQNPYGLPLDNRSRYTKLDWIIWTASITGSRSDFEALIAPVVRFLNETPDRVPMTDWYWTHDARQRGFQARPVVGGVFIRLMDDRNVWNKWVARADSVPGKWAALPKPPKIIDVVSISTDESSSTWYYTFEHPAENWYTDDFDAADAGWQRGRAGFGTPGTPGSYVQTHWNDRQIWIRRQIKFRDEPTEHLRLLVHHDEDADIYLNGVLAARLTGYTTAARPFPVSEEAFKTLKPGTNTIAIHCRQTSGGQYIDAGLVEVIPQE